MFIINTETEDIYYQFIKYKYKYDGIDYNKNYKYNEINRNYEYFNLVENSKYKFKDIIYKIYEEDFIIVNIDNIYYLLNFSIYSVYGIIHNKILVDIKHIKNICCYYDLELLYLENGIYSLFENKIIFEYDYYINSFSYIIHYNKNNNNDCIIFKNSYKKFNIYNNVEKIGYNFITINKRNIIFNNNHHIIPKINNIDNYFSLKHIYETKNKSLEYIGYEHIYLDLYSNNFYYYTSDCNYNKNNLNIIDLPDDYKIYSIISIKNIKSANSI